MSWFDAVTMGLVQGLSEFLPISSSGHVSLASRWLGHAKLPIALIIFFHVGTLLAVLIRLRSSLLEVIRDLGNSLRNPQILLNSPGGSIATEIVIASLPTAIIGLLIKDKAQEFSDLTWPVGLGFIISGILCLCTRIRPSKHPRNEYVIALFIGVAQGLAVLPGISRSASTITAALLLGKTHTEAFRFSFLVSIPAILGALILEGFNPDQLGLGDPSIWIGATTATISGYASLVWLQKLLEKGHFWWFACYLFPLGSATILLYA